MSFIKAFSLKARELFTSPAILAACTLLPILLGLVAGAANLKNRSARVRIAVADLDKTDVSRSLVESLAKQGLEVVRATPEAIAGLVDGKAVDGALVIEQGFTAKISAIDAGGLVYTPAEGTLTANLVLDTVTMAVIPYKSSLVFYQQAAGLYRASGVPLPDGFADDFARRTEESRGEEAKQDFVLVGEYSEPPALTYVVNDYSMEVLFLGFFALLGTLALDTPAMKRRLRASPRGLPYDYFASLLVLVLAGLAQILLYMASMRALMRQPVSPQEVAILAAFLLMSLALAQALALLDAGIRLYLGLIVLLLLSLAGGCFLQLPEQLIRSLSQYIPQGWAMAALRGYPAFPVLPAAGFSIISLGLLYFPRARHAGRLKAQEI